MTAEVGTLTRTCEFQDCIRPLRKRGWCETHYARWRKTGDPLGLRPPKTGPQLHVRRSPVVRALQKVVIADPDECWPFMGKKDRHGYGLLQGEERGKQVRAHRMVFQATYGPIPEGMVIDHTCHTADCAETDRCPHRACCNPAHLEPKSIAENVLRGIAERRAIKASCRKGHLWSENAHLNSKGHWVCRACEKEWAHSAYVSARARGIR